MATNTQPTADHAVVVDDPIAYYGGTMDGNQNFTPWSDSMQQDGGTNGALGSLLSDVSNAEGSGVGSDVGNAPAYNFDGSNTTTSGGGGSPIVWLMLVVVAGAGALWFFMRKKKGPAPSDSA